MCDLNVLREIGIIPVVVLDKAKDADPLGAALLQGGLPCAEVTFRTEAAEQAIRIMKDTYSGLTVGAGTILHVEQVKRAVDAGASFIVSPGFNPQIVEYCLKNEIPVIPGVQTPTEVEMALNYGLLILKFFPAEAAGGLKMIKAIAAPYTTISFIPTGGIEAGNVRDYLAYDRIFACGGSWMVKKSLIDERDFAQIKLLAAEAAGIVREIRGGAKKA